MLLLCELNYTVRKPDGSIDIEKAKEINEQFEISKQFWSHLVKNKSISNPKEFIQPLPHISFVRGKNNVQFLKDRYYAMKDFPMFDNIEYTEDIEEMRKWIPLMMKGHNSSDIMAASKIMKVPMLILVSLLEKWLKILNNIQMLMFNIIMKS